MESNNKKVETFSETSSGVVHISAAVVNPFAFRGRLDITKVILSDSVIVRYGDKVCHNLVVYMNSLISVEVD